MSISGETAIEQPSVFILSNHEFVLEVQCEPPFGVLQQKLKTTCALRCYCYRLKAASFQIQGEILACQPRIVTEVR